MLDPAYLLLSLLLLALIFAIARSIFYPSEIPPETPPPVDPPQRTSHNALSFTAASPQPQSSRAPAVASPCPAGSIAPAPEIARPEPDHLIMMRSGQPLSWSRRVSWEDRPEGAAAAIFLDTETTGLSARDELIEIAMIAFFYQPATGEILGVPEVYEAQREPTCPIRPAAAAVNGFTAEMLADKRLDYGRIEAMLQRSTTIIAHNAAFDRPFVVRLFPGARTLEWRCSMRGIDWRGHGMRSRKLQDLLSAHGLTPLTAHRALADAAACLALLQKTGPHGRAYLAELLANPPLRAPQLRRSRRATAAG